MNTHKNLDKMTIQDCQMEIMQASSQLGLHMVNFASIQKNFEKAREEFCNYIERLDRKLQKMNEVKFVKPAEETVETPITKEASDGTVQIANHEA